MNGIRPGTRWSRRLGEKVLFEQGVVPIDVVAYMIYRARHQALNAWLANYGKAPQENVLNKDEDKRIAEYVVKEFLPLYRKRLELESALKNFYIAKLLRHDLRNLVDYLGAAKLVGLQGLKIGEVF